MKTEIKYPLQQVLNAVHVAYQHSAAGDNLNYVEQKSSLFAKRCMNFMKSDGLIDETTPLITIEIPDYIVKEIAYSALDSDCESILFKQLKAK